MVLVIAIVSLRVSISSLGGFCVCYDVFKLIYHIASFYIYKGIVKEKSQLK